MKRSHMLGILFLVSLMTVLAACTSRYRLDLFFEERGRQFRVEVERSEYYLDAAVGDPYTQPRLEEGTTTVALLHLSVSGRPFMDTVEQKFVMDDQLRCRLYVELPEGWPREPFALGDRSILQVLGRYEWPPEELIFPAQSGTATIDSVTSDQLYLTLTDGRYVNSVGRDVSLYGQVKFRINR